MTQDLTDLQQYLVDEFVEDYQHGHMSRRDAFKRIAAVTGSAAWPPPCLRPAGRYATPTAAPAPTMAPTAGNRYAGAANSHAAAGHTSTGDCSRPPSRRRRRSSSRQRRRCRAHRRTQQRQCARQRSGRRRLNGLVPIRQLSRCWPIWPSPRAPAPTLPCSSATRTVV